MCANWYILFILLRPSSCIFPFLLSMLLSNVTRKWHICLPVQYYSVYISCVLFWLVALTINSTDWSVQMYIIMIFICYGSVLSWCMCFWFDVCCLNIHWLLIQYIILRIIYYLMCHYALIDMPLYDVTYSLIGYHVSLLWFGQIAYSLIVIIDETHSFFFHQMMLHHYIGS